MSIAVEKVMSELRLHRPIFHSEADFQHAMAWQIHTQHSNATVRLEINHGQGDQREYTDIFLKDDAESYAIELKYKTRKLDLTLNEEAFHLQNHGAQDVARYDFVKDITRIERFVDSGPRRTGYAIFLSNDDNYWKETKRLSTFDSMFRIHENRTLHGELHWSEATGAGTMKGRENPLSLKGSHSVRWVDYSDLGPGVARKFRYVLLEVRATNNESIS
jgi:hypothetical protein